MRPKAAVEPPLVPPARLEATHEIDAFDCGNGTLSEWLKKRARRNERDGASRTYVICVERRVIAYYSLASGAVDNRTAPGRIRRNMPNPIPVMMLARLAVDRAWQGRCLGKALLADAFKRTLEVAEIAGIRAIVVHAISEEAKLFYEHHGFTESEVAPLTMMVMLKEARAEFP